MAIRFQVVLFRHITPIRFHTKRMESLVKEPLVRPQEEHLEHLGSEILKRNVYVSSLFIAHVSLPPTQKREGDFIIT